MDELERMYQKSSGDSTGADNKKRRLNFKFKVGDKVTHWGFGYNAVILRRIYIEDSDSDYLAYDLAIWEAIPPLQGESIAEIHLKSGHRIE